MLFLPWLCRGKIDDIADFPLLTVDRPVHQLVIHNDGSGLTTVQAVSHPAAGGTYAETCYIDFSGDMHFTRAGEVLTTEAVQQYVDENNINFSLAFGPILVDVLMSVAGTIMAASSLSFLGMGIQVPAPEWGAMLSQATKYLQSQPYLAIFPGMAILITSLTFNLIGDGLTDALDPKNR